MTKSNDMDANIGALFGASHSEDVEWPYLSTDIERAAKSALDYFQDHPFPNAARDESGFLGARDLTGQERN